MNLTQKQLKQIIKEELKEMYAPDIDQWAPLKQNVKNQMHMITSSLINNRVAPWLWGQLSKAVGAEPDPNGVMHNLRANRDFLYRYYTSSIEYTAKPLGIYRAGESDWSTSPGAKEAVYQTIADHPEWQAMEKEIHDMIDFAADLVTNWDPNNVIHDMATAGSEGFLMAYQLGSNTV